jgi:mRNA-degrading endonuclease YafQ of YafQ-DinJ toxin-antitoxin module
MELIITKKFQKQAKKLVQNKSKLKEKIDIVLLDFSKFDRQSIYYRKKLTGNLFGYEELSVSGDLRIIVRINPDKKKAVLEIIGSHSQLNI